MCVCVLYVYVAVKDWIAAETASNIIIIKTHTRRQYFMRNEALYARACLNVIAQPR